MSITDHQRDHADFRDVSTPMKSPAESLADELEGLHAALKAIIWGDMSKKTGDAP